MSDWKMVMREVVNGGFDHTEDLIRTTYLSYADSSDLFRAMAPMVAGYNERRATLIQGYALAEYVREKKWYHAIECAFDSIEILSLSHEALRVLLHAALALEDAHLIVEHATFVCKKHAEGMLLKHQLVPLFFGVITPYYSRALKTESILVMRRVLYAYNADLSALLYTYLQAHLHASTTEIAQQLIGECDVLAGS